MHRFRTAVAGSDRIPIESRRTHPSPILWQVESDGGALLGAHRRAYIPRGVRVTMSRDRWE